MGKGPEATIENEVRKYAERLAFLFYKFTSINMRGVPDRVVIAPWGLVSFWEFKAPGEQVKSGSAQERRIKELVARNVLVIICDNVERGFAMLDEMQDPLRWHAFMEYSSKRDEEDAPRIIAPRVPDQRH